MSGEEVIPRAKLASSSSKLACGLIQGGGGTSSMAALKGCLRQAANILYIFSLIRASSIRLSI